MASLPDSVADFLRGKRIAVAGVSRSGKEAANAVFRKLRDSGYEALPVNPAAPEVEGVRWASRAAELDYVSRTREVRTEWRAALQ